MQKIISLLLALVIIYGFCPLNVLATNIEASTLNADNSQQSPIIIQQPTSAEARIGEWLKVEVIADGEDLTYQWYLRNAGAQNFTLSSVTSNYYDVVMKESRAGCEVYCVITDANGNSVTTDTVELICLSPEEVAIVTQPESVIVAMGEKARVRVEAVGDGLTYEWYIKNTGESSFRKSTSAFESTYITEMNEVRAGRQIYCVITDQYGNQVQSDTVTLGMESHVQITVQPESVTVPEGEKAKVSFEAEGDGLTYEWFYQNAGESSFRKTNSFTGRTYKVEMTKARAGRQVYCVVTDQYGNNVQTDTVTLHMEKQANNVKITVQPKSVTVPEGEKAKVSFEAEGDGLTYEWFYQNAGESSFRKTNSFTDRTYRVEMTKARAERRVYCVVTDQYGNKVQTDIVTLHMESPPSHVNITVQPKSVTVPNGEIAYVTFEAEGDGLTYEWFYQNAGESSFKKTTSFTGRTYKVEMENARAERQVYCVVTDQYGNKVQTDTVTLHMENHAKITVQPKSVTVAEGEHAKVTLEATGDGLTYEWYIKNAGESSFRKSTSVSGNTYSVKMNQTRAGRRLYCKVTDQYGNMVTTPIVTINMLRDNTSVPAEPDYPYVCDTLNWEKIQAFPIASESMTVEELRTLCIDFFKFSKTFTWTPDEDYSFIRTTSGADDSLEIGTVYGGFPYIHKGSGNVYRFMDFYDSETGILDISEATENARYLGNQCSMGAYWAWARVVNSAQFGSTYHMVSSRGFIPLGEYTYDKSVTDFRTDITTKQICTTNGEQVMYESYACLQPADGLVRYRTGGHVIMCSITPVVIRNEDGTINGKESYIRFIDQSQSWKTQKQSNGDTFEGKKFINSKQTFAELYKDCYIPFTFAEFLGTDPVEELEWEFSHNKASISITQLQRANITSNYGMSDIYAHIKDQNNNVVHTITKRIETASVTSAFFSDAIDKKSIQQYANGDYSVEVVVQFANGERKILYTGQLT